MDFLAEGFRRAWSLLVAGDSEVYGIALLTLKVAVVATIISCAVGLPLGYFLATRRFWGRRAALTVVNTALAFPTVVVGLLLYGLLSRRGPLGSLGWLYTWQAIVVGDVLLALPIAAALYPSQGDFGLALALGLILLIMALLVNVALQALQGRGHA